MAFLEHVLDLLGPMGGVAAKAIDGGSPTVGLYRHGTAFGMVVDDALYLKVDDANREAFVSRHLHPLSSRGKNGRKVAISYFQAPPETLKDGDAMVRWALCSYEAALRGKTSTARAAFDRRYGRGLRARRGSIGLGRATAELATAQVGAPAALNGAHRRGAGSGGPSPLASNPLVASGANGPLASGASRLPARGRTRR
jgi:TfoX/Sxy family transcriptional regulator of competence genes